MCPASIPGIVTEDAQAQVSYWPMFFRKSSNKNDRDQVLYARETEYPPAPPLFLLKPVRCPAWLRSLLSKVILFFSCP